MPTHLLRTAALTFSAACLLAGCIGKPGKQEGSAAGDSLATDSAQAEAPAADTLAYVLQTVEARAADCPAGAAADACTQARIVYPDLGGTGAPVALAANLSRDLALSTDLVRDTIRRVPTLEKLTRAFVDSFEAERKLYRKLDPEAKALPWTLDVKSRLREAQGLVFLESQTFIFSGGAHPNSFTQFRAYDRGSGAPVSLDNLLQDTRARTALTRLAEAQFRRQENLGPKAGYKKGYFFKDDRFDLANNWRIRQDSLEFVYNPYEIKPYAAGQTWLRLPLSAVDSLFTQAYRKPVL